MDFRQILNIAKRWIWLLVLGALIAGGFGYYISNQETPMYQASTRFVILRAATAGFDYYAFIDFQQLIQTYTQLLSTDALLDQASQELGYSAHGVSANASQIGDTQFMRLTVTHSDPVKAAEVANVLVSVLIDQNELLQSVRYETTERNMQQRADQALEQIELLQAQIDQLSTANVQEQLIQVEGEIDALQEQIIALETEISQLETAINQFDPLFATDEQLAQHEANRSRLSELRAEKNQLTPVLSLYQQIYTNLTVLGRTPDGSSSNSIELSRLQTNLNLYQQIYINSISSLESLNLTRAQSAPNVIQVEPARVPNNPISPRPLQDGMLFGAVGLMATAGIAFLFEYLDDSIKTQVDVESHLDLPVLGYVAEMKNGRGAKKDQPPGTVTAIQPRSPVSESFRSLRTSLEFYNFESSLKSLIITSPVEQVGKTTVATNLAIVFAQSNKRVVLVDADLRRPNVHKLLNISNRVGLSDILRSQLKINDVLQFSKTNENFYVITSGSLPPNPADLLGSTRMKNIVSYLEKAFDWVIFDTPPTIVTDAQILSTIADGIIYVIEPGKIRTNAAKKPLEEFRRINANLLGVVLNRIPKNKEYYYGGYNYYSQAYGDSQYHRTE